jgi:hypothetical protein
MNHPILVAALAEDRRRRCPCEAVSQHPYGLCRKCQAAAVWRCETTQSSRRAAPLLGARTNQKGAARRAGGIATSDHQQGS